MNTEITEVAHVMALILKIDKRPGFSADAAIDFLKREMAVDVTEGGREVYRGSIQLHCEASEAKARHVRHQLEQIVSGVAA